MKKILLALKEYLCDWHNLLGHALLGIGLLIFAIWVPIDIIWKLLLILVLVIFNVIRMRISNKKGIEKNN